MSTFTETLTSSEYGVGVNYGGSYIAYVSEDLENGGYFIAYCRRNEDMPPHATDHVDSAEQAEAVLIDCGADFDSLTEIEPEDN